jgi:hypothetical protein
MNRYDITQVISAPGEKVWDALSDVRRWSEWNSSVQKVTALQPESVRLGSRFLVKQLRMPALEYEVIWFEPESFFSLEAHYPGFHIAADHWIFPIPGRKKVAVKLALRQEGLFTPLSRLFFSNLIQKYLVQEVEGLQRKSESVLPYPMMMG